MARTALRYTLVEVLQTNMAALAFLCLSCGPVASCLVCGYLLWAALVGLATKQQWLTVAASRLPLCCQTAAATRAFLECQVAEVLVEAALQRQAQNKVVEIVASKKEDAPPKDKWFA